MRKRVLFFYVLVVLTIVVFAVTARADTIQAWNESGVGTFDKVDAFIQTPGVVFGNPGISSAWTDVNVNPTFASATGPATTSFDFSTFFVGNTSEKFVVNFYALMDGTVVDSAKLTYPVNGQPYGWEVDPLCAKHFGEENTAVTPEPGTLLLLGTGLFGLGFLLRRKMNGTAALNLAQ